MGRKLVLLLSFPIIIFLTICFAFNAGLQNACDNLTDYFLEFYE